MALLFSILKVIGMILLIIVIILAVIIACLLFIPVCYEASGDISAGNYRVRVHWFLRAFQFLFYRRDGTNEMELRLFWRRSHLLDAEYREKRKEKKAEKAAKKQSRKKQKKQHLFRKKREKLQKKIDLDTEPKQNTSVKMSPEEEKIISEQKPEVEAHVLNHDLVTVSQVKIQHNETQINRDDVFEKNTLTMNTDVGKSESVSNTFKQEIALDIENEDSTLNKNTYSDNKNSGKNTTGQKEQHTVKQNDTEDSIEQSENNGKLKDILKKVNTAWSLMQTWHPLAMIWPPLQKLLYRIRPRMLKTDLIFGFADPSTTGKVLGAVSNLYFLYYYEEFHLQGDFETEDIYIDGTFMIRGKIRGIYLLVFVIRLLSKKDFRKFLGAIKKSKNGGN